MDAHFIVCQFLRIAALPREHDLLSGKTALTERDLPMQLPQKFVSVFHAVQIRPAIFADLSFHVQTGHVLLIHHRRVAQTQPAVVAQDMTAYK